MQSKCDKYLETIRKGPATAEVIGEALWQIDVDKLFLEKVGSMETFYDLYVKMDPKDGLKIIEKWKQTPDGKEVIRKHKDEHDVKTAPVGEKAPSNTKDTGNDAGETIPTVEGTKSHDLKNAQIRRTPDKQVLTPVSVKATPAKKGDELPGILVEDNKSKQAPGPATATPPDAKIKAQPVGNESEQAKPTNTKAAKPCGPRSQRLPGNGISVKPQGLPLQSNDAPVHVMERIAVEAPSPKSLPTSDAALVTDANPDFWVPKINEHLTDGVAALIMAGRDLIVAKEKLDHGQFHSMFAPGRLQISQRTAELFMKVAQHPALSKSNNYSLLPPALNALTTLSKLPEAKLQEAINEKKVTPQMTIAQARALVVETVEDKKKDSNPDAAGKMCDRGIMTIAAYVEQAKSWAEIPRKRFIDELKRLLESLAD